ncbi:hypothetical protein [uncultured Phycicoccus sp.]|uniref:hypothetical protein n=1 Tax=uncultured Phycicoccus sp. TaxID=661422 RepID=UPI002615675F|nr:hypothetical protein [uncultured Phycicoccus sp.]
METTTKTAAAMTAAHVTCDAVWIGANTAHSGDLGQVQGRGVSAFGTTARDRADQVGVVVAGIDAPTQGSVYPRLEGPPV